MNNRKRLLLALAGILLLAPIAQAGLGSKKTMYVGGTLNTIPERTEGTSSTTGEKHFVFDYSINKAAKNLSIPYDKINGIEYGQKAGRRVGVAIAATPLALLSKKRKHYLTINFTDENDKQQAAVFELGKDAVRVTLSVVESRSGRKIEYQDDEARKGAKGQ